MSLLGLKGLRKLVHGHQTGSEWMSNEKKKGIRMNKKGRTKQLQLKYKARKQRKKPSKKRSKGMIREETKRSASKKDEKPGQSAPLQRGENLQKRSYLCTAATAGTVLVYQLTTIKCFYSYIALNTTISKRKKSYGLLPVVINTIGQPWLGKPSCL